MPPKKEQEREKEKVKHKLQRPVTAFFIASILNLPAFGCLLAYNIFSLSLLKDSEHFLIKETVLMEWSATSATEAYLDTLKLVMKSFFFSYFVDISYSYFFCVHDNS